MAVPFNAPTEDRGEDRFLVIENLIRELLTLIRWMPTLTTAVVSVQTDSSNNSNHDATTDDDATLQQRRAGNLQHAARGFAVELLYSMSAATSNRRSQQTRPSHVRPQAQAQRPSSQQQTLEQNVLPDLIMSCTTPHDRSADKESAEAKTARPPTVRPSSYRSSSRSAVRPSIRFTVKLCPRCYHDRRKSSLLLQCTSCRILEEKTDRSPPDNDDDDEGSVVAVRVMSNIKWRIMSLLHPSKIDSSILTAAFVIIGWKMFIKQ